MSPSITLFAIPKPFTDDHIDVIQRNAIASWCCLRPFVDVILLGDELGYDEIAAEYGLRQIKDVARNEFGTPLLNSVFQVAEEASDTALMCYINADIVLIESFISAVKAAQEKWSEFLLVGRRFDADIVEPVNFQEKDWADKVLRFAYQNGELHAPNGIDYFVFPRGLWNNVPPFAIGRVGFDNWLLYNVRFRRIPLVDSTAVNTIIHQNHHYRHLPGGETELRFGLEGERNRELGGGKECSFNINDATWLLTDKGLRRASSPSYLWIRFRRSPVLLPKFYWLLGPIVHTITWIKGKTTKFIKSPLTAIRDTLNRLGHSDA